MKDMFFEYIMDESGQKKKVLEDSIIILDTNALLNLYRLSSNNRKKYFDILEKVNDRIFLTNHSVKEFFENRLNIFRNKLSLKENLKIQLEGSFNSIKNQVLNCNFNGKNKESSNLIKYEQKLKNDIAEIIDKNIKEISDTIDDYKIDIIDEKNSSKDEILDRILELFDKRVNTPFSDEELNAIYSEGKQRYEKQVPPGYMDKEKGGAKCFGDLIIWKEIIRISKKEEKNILFVSDDRKDDWCVKFNGEDLGPRKELIRELYKSTGKLFYSVTTTDFIRYMSEIYKINETDELQKETDELQVEQDITYKELNNDRQKDLFNFINTLNDIDSKFDNNIKKREAFLDSNELTREILNLDNNQKKSLVNQFLNDEYHNELNKRILLNLDDNEKKNLFYKLFKDNYKSRIIPIFKDNEE